MKKNIESIEDFVNILFVLENNVATFCTIFENLKKN